jgi:hypothetical protein
VSEPGSLKLKIETMAENTDTVHTGGHKRSLRGCAAIGLVDERSQNLRKRDCVLSWDANCVILWENGAVIHELKFPKSKECYISCVTYITKLNGT